MPSASSGVRTSYSTVRVFEQRVDVERGRPGRARSRPTSATRAGSASTPRCSMNVANASFSQMPFHHFIVTRSPNHMCAISCTIVSAAPVISSSVTCVGIEQQARLAERDAAEVLHRAEREVGERDEVALLARIRDAVVVGEERDRERADVERELREVPSAGDVRDAHRDAARVDRRRSARADRRPTRRDTSTSGSCRRNGRGRLPPGVSRLISGPFESASRPSATSSVIAKTALNSGSSKHGNARAGVRRLELGRGRGPVRAPSSSTYVLR